MKLNKLIAALLAALLVLSSAALADIAIGVPNDTTNEARALQLLADNGIIELAEGAGETATKADVIADGIEIVEVQADLLVLLSDIDGLFDADPHSDPNARLIPTVSELTEEILRLAGGSGTWRGTGGMATKLSAAAIVMGCGCDMVLSDGSRPERLYDIVEGKDVGTRFIAKEA